MTQEQLYPDGWYKIWYGDKHFNIVHVVDGVTLYFEGAGISATVAEWLKWGYTLEPVEVLPTTDLAALRARVAELEADANRMLEILMDYDATRGKLSWAWDAIDNEIERMNEEGADHE